MSLGLRPRLEMRQSQQLVMTPQLRQAISMLQMSTVELSAHLAEAIAANPLVMLADGLGAAAPGAPATTPEAVDAALRRADLAEGERQFVTGRENLYESSEMPGRGAAAARLDDGEGDRTDAIADAPSLAAHVAAQVTLMRLPPLVRRTALLLAGELDESGYLRTPDAELATRLGLAAGIVAAARSAIQDCEPTGIGARDLAECLALQLAERDRLDPAMQALVGALGDLPTTPAAVLARRCGVDASDFADMLAELRSLDPRPGLQYGGGTATPINPDVIVRPGRDGGWRVTLNPAATPRLLIDSDYAASVGGRGGRETRLFLAECAQNATWLRRSLDQRARTILSVAAEIVRVQSGFFDHGLTALRPLTLKAVADAVGVHESTVSRVTANKYLASPRGFFELKFFFTVAIAASGGGEAHSAQAVRDRIRALIAGEPPGKPLSDDVLVRQLQAEGIDVARRTVAKYREALQIPSSVERRRRAEAAV